MTLKNSKSVLVSMIAAVFMFVLLTACSQLLGGQKSSVSFCIDSDIVKELQIPAAGASSSRSVADDLEIAKLSVTLNGEYSKTQTSNITPEGAVIFFPDIPTGKKIWAQAEVYIENTADGSKTILYTGKSKSIRVSSGENQLDIQLKKVEKQYNVVSKTATTYTVLNPTFKQEKDDAALETNEITYNFEDYIEQVYWKPSDVNVYDYQKARITYRGTSLKTDQENVLAFKTIRAGTYKSYYRDQKSVSKDFQTYEMMIPQGKRIDSLGIENKWDTSTHEYQKDFSFEITKIELIKVPELAIDYNALVYVDEWPELQVVNNAQLRWGDKPGFTFTSKEGKGNEFENGDIDDGYASVYWEFDHIQDYDKIALTVKVDNYKPEDGIRFSVKGYRPYYDNAEDVDYHSEKQSWVQLDTPATVKDPNDPVYGGESVRVVLAVSDILKGIQGNPDKDKDFAPTAIEIINDLYDGTWGNWYDDWGMQLEKIEMIRVAQKDNLVIFDPDTVDLSTFGISGYNSDAAPSITEINGKKYLPVKPNGYALDITLPDEIDVSGYLYVVAEVAFPQTTDDLEKYQAGVVMRYRTEQTKNLIDYEQRTVLDAMCEAATEGRNAMGIICGFEKINKLSAYILNKENNNNPTVDQQMYIGKIYATTKKDVPVRYAQTGNNNSSNDPVPQTPVENVIAQINALTASGSVIAPAEASEYQLTVSDLLSIAAALDTLAANKPDVEVTLDLSAFSNSAGVKKITSSDLPEGKTYLFTNNSNLKEITLPSRFTSVGNLFNNCTKLETVNMPDTMAQFPNYSFDGCSALTKLTINGSESATFGSGYDTYKLENHAVYNTQRKWLIFYYARTLQEVPVISSGTVDIYNNAFDGCSITSVTIPETVTTIASHSFQNCKRLTSVTVSEGTTSINGYAFSSCSALTTLTLPASLDSIVNGAFNGCNAITDVYYAGTEEQKDQKFGATISNSNGSLASATWHCQASQTQTPVDELIARINAMTKNDTVSATAEAAEYQLTANDLVSIANALDTLAANKPDIEVTLDLSAFSNSEGIKKINGSDLPSGKTALFLDNSNLKEITLPSRFTSIGNLFANCTKLETINMPDTITQFPDYSFIGCPALTNFTINGSESATFGSGYDTFKLENHAVYDTQENRLLLYYARTAEEVPVISSGTQYISNYAFDDCSITSVTIPGTVSLITAYAFQNCKKLTSVTISEGTTKISGLAFRGCSALTALALPVSLTSIEKNAFYNCSGITDVYYAGTEAEKNQNLPTIPSEGNGTLTTARWHYQSSMPFVDLGLPSKTLWAKMNYGATSESDVGTLLDWNYETASLGPEYEVATAAQWEELWTECLWLFEYDNIEHYSYYKVYRKKFAEEDSFVVFLPTGYDEANDLHLIIPADSDQASDDEGYYWPKKAYETLPEGQKPNVIRLYSGATTTTWTLENEKPTQHPVRCVMKSN